MSDWSSDVCSSDLADALIVIARRHAFERLHRMQQRDAAARDDAFLDGRAGRVHRVVDAVLALLHLDLGRPADADHRHAAGQRSEEHTSELQSLMRISYAVFCLKEQISI